MPLTDWRTTIRAMSSPCPAMRLIFALFNLFPPCCPSGIPDGMQIKFIYNGYPLQISKYLPGQAQDPQIPSAEAGRISWLPTDPW